MKLCSLVLITFLAATSVFADPGQASAAGLTHLSRQNASANAIQLAMKQYKQESGREMKLVNFKTMDLQVVDGDDVNFDNLAGKGDINVKLADVTYQVTLEAQAMNRHTKEVSEDTVKITAVLNCEIDYYSTHQHVGVQHGWKTECKKESLEFGVEKGE